MRGGINPGDIRVHSRVVRDLYVWMDYDPDMRPYRPQMTATLCTIPTQCATSDQTKDHTRYKFFYFRPLLEPEILNCQILSAVLSRTTNNCIYQIATNAKL